jgi:pimeloyl-ACP methyl ester carboxylesterase
MRRFAEAVAAAGLPALRFDYSGSGDSADGDAQADQIETWCGEIVAAMAELRRRTGVKHVCLLGFRLGAMLAALAAQRCNSADFLILVAPVVSGRRYVGEMRTTTLAAALTLNGADAAKGTPGARAATADGSMEVSAHRVSAATIAHLSRMDLAASAAPRVARVLIIDRDDVPTARKWAESLRAQGLPIEYAALPGFVKMMMTAPPFTSIPHEMIGFAREWLLRLVSPPQSAATTGEDPATDRQCEIPQTTFLPC